MMQAHVISVTTQTDQEEVAHMFAKYNFLALPVVDNENRMVGIVTFDDAMDVMEEEATEDIEIMAGMSPSEKNYRRATTLDLFKQRIPWLLLLMVSATFTGMIITSFENALAAQVETQRQENDALAADIAEGATDEKMKEIAQEELGLISPNQRVFSVGN